MINKAHSIANNILGLHEITNIDNKCKLIVYCEDSSRIVELKDSLDNTIKILKVNNTNHTYEYNLDPGQYYLHVYIKDRELLVQCYYEDIYIFNRMLNTFKVVEVIV